VSKLPKLNIQKFIENNLIECDLSYRGGTIKVDVAELFPYIDDATIGAYQNYLGGGLVGAIVGASMFTPDELKAKDVKLYRELLEGCKEYIYKETNHEYDEWETASYEETQSRPVSAY
jgi:hypothetical protein